ncbi:hypothetical protein HAX54_043519 [Datura stramonium]|uniref:RWP-RK domain-containing protein n=1 Tax=Datura stramonium TaxID=4076 RepID=A0ABS8SNQ5_DATST|nr:hypothetical protein [Datura stramonium]
MEEVNNEACQQIVDAPAHYHHQNVSAESFAGVGGISAIQSASAEAQAFPLIVDTFGNQTRPIVQYDFHPHLPSTQDGFVDPFGIQSASAEAQALPEIVDAFGNHTRPIVEYDFHHHLPSAQDGFGDPFGIQSALAESLPEIIDNFGNQSISYAPPLSGDLHFFQDSFLQQEHLLNGPNPVSNDLGYGHPQVQGGETLIDVASVTTWTPIGCITTQYLTQLYGNTRADAAKHLQVSVATFKRICRKHGIARWPGRYFRRLFVDCFPVGGVREGEKEEEDDGGRLLFGRRWCCFSGEKGERVCSGGNGSGDLMKKKKRDDDGENVVVP